MTSYVVLLLPPNTNNLPAGRVADICDKLSGKNLPNPPICFEQTTEHPRSGFESSSFAQTDYGFKAKFVYEEEIIIPTAEGEKREFKKTSIDGKFIKSQGVLLIGTTNDAVVKALAKKWLDIMFPDRIVPFVQLSISRPELDKFVTNNARTVIGMAHRKVKGLETIKMNAVDLPNTNWYKQEGFDSTTVSQITFIPKLTGALSNKTSICRIYKNGKIVIYHNSNFTDVEFEQIELQLVEMLSQILGAPLCKKGPKESQGKLS